jgi:hypothetical protein
MLPGQDNHRPQTAVTDGYGAIAENGKAQETQRKTSSAATSYITNLTWLSARI